MAEPVSKIVRKKKSTSRKTVARKRSGQTGSKSARKVETQDAPAESPLAASEQPEVPAIADATGRQSAVRSSEDLKDGTSGSGSPPSGTGKSAGGVGWTALALSLVSIMVSGYAGYLVLVDSRISLGQQQSRLELVGEQLDTLERTYSGYAGQIQDVHTRLVESEAELGDRLRDIQDTVSELARTVRDRIDETETRTGSSLETFRREVEILSASIIRIQEDLGQDVDTLVLKEVGQLVSSAQFRLRYDRNVNLALQALGMAHRKLENLSLASHAGIMRQLSADLETLAGVKTLDVAEMLSRLDMLDDTVGNLDLAGDLIPGGSVGGAPATESVQESPAGQGTTGTLDRYTEPLMDAGRELLSNLGDLIQIERQDETIRPILSADMRQLIYERTRLLLDEARVILVQQRFELLSERLQRLQEWATHRFDMSSEGTRKWLAQLDEVRQSVPDGELPDLSGSVRSVQEALSRKGLVQDP